MDSAEHGPRTDIHETHSAAFSSLPTATTQVTKAVGTADKTNGAPLLWRTEQKYTLDGHCAPSYQEGISLLPHHGVSATALVPFQQDNSLLWGLLLALWV